MASFAKPLLDKPTTQEAFVLMLHDRVVEAERLIANLQESLVKQPCDDKRLKIFSCPRGWFFTFKAYRDCWPAAGDAAGLRDKAQCLFDALGHYYAWDAALVMSQEKIVNIRFADALNEVVTGERGPPSDAVVDDVFARPFVIVEGVITTDKHGCNCDVVGKAIEDAWRASWITDQYQELFRPEWRDRLDDTLQVMIGLDSPAVQELGCPDAWRVMMAASSLTQYEMCMLGRSGEVLVAARSQRPSPLEKSLSQYRLAVSLDSRIRPQTVAVKEFIDELFED